MAGFGRGDWRTLSGISAGVWSGGIILVRCGSQKSLLLHKTHQNPGRYAGAAHPGSGSGNDVPDDERLGGSGGADSLRSGICGAGAQAGGWGRE